MCRNMEVPGQRGNLDFATVQFSPLGRRSLGQGSGRSCLSRLIAVLRRLPMMRGRVPVRTYVRARWRGDVSLDGTTVREGNRFSHGAVGRFKRRRHLQNM